MILSLGALRHSGSTDDSSRNVLSASEDDDASAALWRFLADHACHRVSLLDENFSEWDSVRIDFVTIGGDEEGDPSFGQYVRGWSGYDLVKSPRPLADEIVKVIKVFDEAFLEVRWLPSMKEAEAILDVVGRISWPPRADVPVSLDMASSRAHEVGELTKSLVCWSVALERSELGRFFRTVAGILQDGMISLGDEALVSGGRLVSAELYDAEWTLALIKDFLNGYVPRARGVIQTKE
ncbi:hypothetical protein [Streptacidiphilus fuscans]|uniref:Uncharacterized protein n=1 Tax=Streptacidiphilus fuscans TaxID=2789292 RepID=A0A931B5S7_9ACTN|nr:hypothetical protein [Streptacidiphilus fuscans]MBF9069162.1 hypothetical protein [Streptacidiphilus fuscans]